MLSAVSRNLTPPPHSYTQRTLQTAGDDSRILPSSARLGPEGMGFPDLSCGQRRLAFSEQLTGLPSSFGLERNVFSFFGLMHGNVCGCSIGSC